MRTLPSTLSAVLITVLPGCASKPGPPAPCPSGPTRADLAVARAILADAGNGEHQVELSDGGCWLLWERRNGNGPREWKLSAIRPDGVWLRKRIELELKEGAAEKCSEFLERPAHWHNDNFWIEWAETIETCVDDGDAGEVRCFGAAIH